jgi:hypothetical protein
MSWKIHNIEIDMKGELRRRDVVPGPAHRGRDIQNIHGILLQISIRRKDRMRREGMDVAPSRSMRGGKKFHMVRLERFFCTRTRARKDYESRIRSGQAEGL